MGFFFSSRRRHTRYWRDWSSDVCSSDLSDYALWHPKWQVEMFVDWDYPVGYEYDDFPRLSTEGKKKILGLNAARLYDIEVSSEERRGGKECRSRWLPYH